MFRPLVLILTLSWTHQIMECHSVGGPQGAGLGPGHCDHDLDCPDWNTCRAGHCRDPCRGACGHNANCVARGHEAVCGCPPGWSGEANTECRPQARPPCPWYLECDQ